MPQNLTPPVKGCPNKKGLTLLLEDVQAQALTDLKGKEFQNGGTTTENNLPRVFVEQKFGTKLEPVGGCSRLALGISLVYIRVRI